MNTTALKLFRITALIEGVSWLFLISAMVLKYGFAIKEPVKYTGWFHDTSWLLVIFGNVVTRNKLTKVNSQSCTSRE